LWSKGSFWSSNGHGFSFVKGGGFVGLGGRSLRSCTKGCGDVGGDPNNFIGSSLGNVDGDGVLDVWIGALGGVGSMGDFVGGGVVSSLGPLGDGDGDGDARFRKCSFLMGEENSSEDEEHKLIVWFDQSGLTLMRAVLRMGRDG
jgi:hypothetical protein